MPSPANPHRSSAREESVKSTPTKKKPLDLGPQLGPYDTNSVREKIRRWQKQGGGVITANDVYFEEDDGKATKPKSKPGKENLGSKNASGSGVRTRSSSTPKKRVISDEHWRIKRSTAQTPPPKRPPPKKISVYTTNDQLLSPRGKKDAKKDEKTRLTPSPRSAEKVKASHASPLFSSREPMKSKSPRDVDNKIEEEDKPHDKTPSRSVTKEDTQAKEVSDLKPGMRRNTPPPEDVEWAASEADFSELSKRRARGASYKPRSTVKPSQSGIPKGGIFAHMLDESRKVFGKPEPSKPVPHRGAKIEAWLSNTLDPFSEDGEPPVEIPAPLNPKSGRPRQSSKRDVSHDRITSSEPSSDGDSRLKRSNSRRVTGKEEVPAAEKEPLQDEKSVVREREEETPPPSSVEISNAHKANKPSIEVKKNDTACEEVQHEASDTETHPFSDGSEVSGSNPPIPLGRKRPFPSTGIHQLSTIPSVETLRTPDCEQSQAPEPNAPSEKRDSNTGSESVTADPEERDQFDTNSVLRVSSKLKRRLTTHDDLMSVLSAPSGRSRSIRSARSIRTNRSRLGTATMGELLQELSADEAKYMRELKTLVGGVIPVLLTCVLSRSDSAVAAGLFRPSVDPKDDLNFTKPIVDMGVTLERLKTLHKRIPQDDVDTLLHWAQGAQRVYREYLKAWRLGFRDVIVNLAPLEEGEAANDSETRSLDEGLARDENGDVVGSDGEKVDVAYLLKRPLVRLKYLAKSFKGINTLQPSAKAEEVAMAYQDLVTEARRRAREERARLEDESAASIDPTRVRDPTNLAVLTGVTVDRTRRVRARDFFNLSLYHSSGQVVDCRAELLLRDNAPENGAGGDLLICEIDHAERWLLFPPIDLGCVSARNGDAEGEIVVMLRGPPGQEKSWQELLSLRIDEEEVGFEWAQMLGLNPTPPPICRSQSFVNRAKQQPQEQSASTDAYPNQKVPASLSDVDVPMGEKKALLLAARSSPTPKEQFSEPSTVGSTSVTGSRGSLCSAITRESDYAQGGSELSAKSSRPPLPSIVSSRDSGDEEKTPTLRRSKAKRISRLGELSPQTPASPSPAPSDRDKTSPSTPRRFYEEVKQIEQSAVSAPKSNTPREQHPPAPTKDDICSKRPPRVSCVPSMDLPTIRKLRDGSSQPHLLESSSFSSDEDDDSFDDFSTVDEPDSSPDAEGAPAPPPHRSPSSTGQKLLEVPVINPTGGRLKRHGSSPLKHEYEPSTASDSYYSDASTVRHYEIDDSSSCSSSYYTESESDYESGSDYEDHDVSLQSRETGADGSFRSIVQASSVLGSGPSSLSPSKSVSQSAYRTVPAQPSKSSKAIASVFAWADTGTWMSLVPDECTIVVSPGLIEAYEMSPDENVTETDGTSSDRGQPLIALELTPLVPIRRGTAIDISVRSPPTERSKVTSSNNIMFRSRNTEECDALYGLINQARINNPTYIALQNARGPFAEQPITFETSNDKSEGWFGWPRRRKSYRASPNAPRSSAEVSESSVGTMSSAFSALKRFGAGSKMFSIARSTITSKTGDKGGSAYSASADSGLNPSPNSGIERIAAAIRGADGIGLSNAKIRLYIRETQSKWRDMGAARLTIMPAPSTSSTSDSPRPTTAVSGRSDADGADGSSGSGSTTPRRESEPSKRILIRGKTRGEVLLDVCLGESSFERVARTGIAISVWEENEGGTPAKQQGGVTVGAFRIYMIQMKSEAEAAYTFGLVGKLRY